MKKLLIAALAACTFGTASAQEDLSLEQLRAQKVELQAELDAAKAQANATQAQLDELQKDINQLSGWMTGFTGLVGFDLRGSNQWIANPNPTSRSTGLSIGVTAYANREQPKYFWNNKAIVNKAWQKVDIKGDNDSDLFDNGTVDLLNISSLAGYKINRRLALSGLGEFNSSIGNFLEPATLDLGVGITAKPITNLTILIHPLNYHIAWAAQDDIDSQGSIGAKIRADYQDDLYLFGRKLAWSSTLTSFLPYKNNKTIVNDVDKYGNPVLGTDDKPLTREAGLFEYTWLNTISFQVWDGIGVGANLGIRRADFEYAKMQTFYGLGLTYTL